MKYIKTYEDINYIRPKMPFDKGYWVKISNKVNTTYEPKQLIDEYINFLENNIGKVVDYDRNRILLRFYDIPEHLRNVIFTGNTKSFALREIEDYAKTKSELEEKLNLKSNVKKYNL